MKPSPVSPLDLKPVVPLLDLLLRIREDMQARSVGPYRYIGMPDVGWVMGFTLGYQEVLSRLGVYEGSDLLFGVWLRDIKRAWPGEGWESAYLRECNGDQTRALRKYLDYVAEFKTLSLETLAALPWRDPVDVQLAARPHLLTPTQVPPTTLDFLLEIHREIGDTEGRLGMFIGPIQIQRMEGLIAGYRLGLALVGVRDEEYVRFERWLHDEQGLADSQEWPAPFLAVCQDNSEQAIRRLLGFAADFRST